MMKLITATLCFISARWVINASPSHQEENELVSRRVEERDDLYEDYEICEVTPEQDCNYAYLKANLPRRKKSWIVAPGGDTKCIDGSPFGFQVFPGETDKLMFWFQGGGACYDYQTCVTSPMALQHFNPNDAGIFNMDLEGNPLVSGGWTAIVNNYCTGDMFFGNAVRELSGVNNVTKASETVTVYHNGYNNTMAVLDWMKAQPEFPPEQEIVSGGCSAGSLGVQVWADFIVNNYGIDKIQPDSYIGYLPPEANAALQQWNSCDCAIDLGLAQKIIDDCYDGLLYEMPPVFFSFLEKNKNIPVAYTGSAHDAVQRGYYALLANPDYDGDNSVLLPAFIEASLTFSNYQWTVLNSYKAEDQNFSDYIVDSSNHCFINRNGIYGNPNFNSPYSNQTMLEYIDNFLNKDVYNGSPDYPLNFPPVLENTENLTLFVNQLFEYAVKSKLPSFPLNRTIDNSTMNFLVNKVKESMVSSSYFGASTSSIVLAINFVGFLFYF